MMAAGATASATSASPPSVMRVGRLAPWRELASHLADGLDQLLGHPADGRQDFAQGESRQNTTTLLNAVLALPGGPLFQSMIDLVPDAAGFLDGLLHGKDQAGNGHLGPLLQMKAMSRMLSDPVTPAGLPEIGVTLASVDEHDRHLGLMAITLADHFGSGAELAGRAVDGGSRAEAAEFEFKDRGGMAVGKGDGIKLAESVAAAKVIAQLRVLVTEDAPVPEFEVTGEEGANAELGGGTDDGEGGGLNADFTGAFPLASAAYGEALGPAEVFAVVGVDEFRFAVVGRRGGVVRIQGKNFRVSWRPPRNRCQRCRELGRGYHSKTIQPQRKTSGGPPSRAGKGRLR